MNKSQSLSDKSALTLATLIQTGGKRVTGEEAKIESTYLL